LVQAGLVALPSPRRLALPLRLRTRGWALAPAASIVIFVILVRAASASAQGLSYLALVAVPPLAALALGWGIRGSRSYLAFGALVLLGVAWGLRSDLVGEGAALALTGCSCVSLALVLVALTPPRWLKVGIVAMAIVDTASVVSDLLQAPNNLLNAAHPAAGLPALQRALFGSAVMGYGDLFLAALLGGVLAAQYRRQLRAAALAAVLALSFDLLFFFVSELPATVPIALTLIVLELQDRVGGSRAHVPARLRRR
jgi:hypothetical protein